MLCPNHWCRCPAARTNAELLNTELMKSADQDKISAAKEEQVKLVGSLSLYEKINKNFKELRIDALFAKVKLDVALLILLY